MEIYNTSSSQYESENSKTFSMIKIYAFMALALLITGLVGYGLLLQEQKLLIFLL